MDTTTRLKLFWNTLREAGRLAKLAFTKPKLRDYSLKMNRCEAICQCLKPSDCWYFDIDNTTPNPSRDIKRWPQRDHLAPLTSSTLMVPPASGDPKKRRKPAKGWIL